MQEAVYTFDRCSQSVAGWGIKPRHSQACVCVYECVCVCYCVCIREGIGPGARKQGGYTVWLHMFAHHPPFLQVSACFIFFFSLPFLFFFLLLLPPEDRDSAGGKHVRPNTLWKYRLADCGLKIHLNSCSRMPLCSAEMQRWLCGSLKKKKKKKERNWTIQR